MMGAMNWEVADGPSPRGVTLRVIEACTVTVAGGANGGGRGGGPHGGGGTAGGGAGAPNSRMEHCAALASYRLSS